ncbi:MAG: hypothetical protein K2M55_04845, partial [Muribaculaceae bacterium]|nr:hypothetical protein [Muribaculaceae bacterium]
ERVPDSPALRPAIVVALPFGLDNPTPTRTNRLALDFYRGFLLAADTLSQRGSAIEIVAVDTEGADFAERIADTAVATAQVTVAPAEADRMATLASLAADRGSWVLNVLNVPDTLYAVNALVLQANVPQRNMYALAADAFIADYADYTPVVLRCDAGKNEKEAFVAYLTGRLESKGILPVEISYEDNLTSSHLDRLAPGGKYVFVPLSGSLAEFNKFAYALKSWRDRLAAEADAAAAENPDSYATTSVALFGYPDWTVFRGDALDMLHRLEAKVYSRFYDNFHSFDARTLESSFRRWYGEPILESVPSQAILGYDTGCYLIKNLRANNGEFNPTYPTRYQGIQSTFDFDRDGDAGYYNSSLYIINYLPGDGISSRVL